jgi:SNF2-related domain
MNCMDSSILQTWNPCHCDEPKTSRVPICVCQNKEVSAFLQVRWKRLVIDEGHVSAGLSCNLIYFLKLLSVERVWVVTATPTTNLMPVREDAGLSDDTELCAWYANENRYRTMTIDDVLVNESIIREGFRVWDSFDRRDLRRMENMITHFLDVPRFHADPESFYSHVSEPLLKNTGPDPGSIQVLIQVMGSIMIRHR